MEEVKNVYMDGNARTQWERVSNNSFTFQKQPPCWRENSGPPSFLKQQVLFVIAYILCFTKKTWFFFK